MSKWAQLLEEKLVRIRPFVSTFFIVGLIALFLAHLAVIWIYAVNVPYADEWMMAFSPLGPPPFTFRWIITPHNEHQILTTHFFIAAQYYLNGWNVRTNIILNFLIYGVTLLWLIRLARRMAPHLSLGTVAAFTLFMLSPIDWMNHLIGLQVCFHFWLLFFLISAYFLFDARQSWARIIVATVALILSMCSLAAGLFSGVVLCLFFTLFKIARAKSAENATLRRTEICQLLLVTLSLIGAIGLWLKGYEVSPTRFQTIMPNHLAFWRMFLNLISFGFGVDTISSTIGIICLLIVLVPFAYQLVRRKSTWPVNRWASLGVTSALLVVIASVAMGRTALGLEWSKVSRYSEMAMPLILLTAVNWSWMLRKKSLLHHLALVTLWLICVVAFADNWSTTPYRELSEAHKVGVRCIENYYRIGGAAQCNHLANIPLATYLDKARELDASFYREAEARIKASSENRSGR